MSESNVVLLERHEGYVALVTLNRPESSNTISRSGTDRPT